MIPITIVAFGLVFIGVAFVVVEAHVPGFGVAGMAGIVSFVLAAILFADAGAVVHFPRWGTVALLVAIALYVPLVAVKVARARRQPQQTNASVVGTEGVATTDIDPVGTVRVRSELWTAEAAGEPIPSGSRVRVVGEHGLTLVVSAP